MVCCLLELDFIAAISQVVHFDSRTCETLAHAAKKETGGHADDAVRTT